MRALTTFMLALGVFAGTLSAAADVIQAPIANKPYQCEYRVPQGRGLSTFKISGNQTLKRGIEDFTFQGVEDNRKVTFAIKPENGTVVGGTRWEYTVNPGGVQCKHTDVFNAGRLIIFDECSDGSLRFCFR